MQPYMYRLITTMPKLNQRSRCWEGWQMWGVAAAYAGSPANDAVQPMSAQDESGRMSVKMNEN